MNLIGVVFFFYIYVTEYEGIINPPGAEFVVKAIEKAEKDGEIYILMLDTPGGLDESMRMIIKKIFESRIPVCVYVFPPGGRAASAGAFITVAAHIAAMAPGTNIGAAHPVAVQGQMDTIMMGKVLNDAVSYIKSIGQKRNRDTLILEEMVRKSISLTAKEALKKGVIDYVVPSLDSLLTVLEGKEINLNGKVKKLRLKEREIKEINMGLREKILMVLTNPTIAYILLILGFYGLFFEITNPGTIFPGVIGAISLILAFYSFQTLPVNYAGVLLIILSMVLFFLEIKIQSHGVLGAGGILSLLLGSILLFKTDVPFLEISKTAIIVVVVLTALFFFIVIAKAVESQLRKPVSGKEGMIGEKGIAKTKISSHKTGLVLVHGEIWKAISDEDIEKGEEIIVIGIDGLKLKVKKGSIP
jgi:membrane-bound serine protease (ClpP class)